MLRPCYGTVYSRILADVPSRLIAHRLLLHASPGLSPPRTTLGGRGASQRFYSTSAPGRLNAVPSRKSTTLHGAVEAETVTKVPESVAAASDRWARFTEPAFDDPKVAFGSKTYVQLLRAYVVFRLCSIGFFVRNQAPLLRWSRRLLGRALFMRLMRATLYGQFLAGEDRDVILEAAHHHRKHGVIPMFAYTAKESHGIKGEKLDPYDDPLWEINFNAMMDEVDMSSEAIDKPGNCTKMSGKFTFLVPPEVMQRVTDVIAYNTKLFDQPTETTEHSRLLNQCIDDVIRNTPKLAESTGLPLPNTPWTASSQTSYATNLVTHLALMKNADLAKITKAAGMEAPPILTDRQESEVYKLWDWLMKLGERSLERDVILVMDAEQTYLQLAMDIMTLDMMRVLNHKRATVHNTYQCYLRRTYDIVLRDLAIADREGFCFGGKFVRGAYIDEERRLASELNYPDPVNPTYDATSDMYHKVARLMLERFKSAPPGRTQITFATHNIDTVKTIINMMKEMDVVPEPQTVGFAQLHGMRDYIAFPLGQAGYPSQKLLHYGPVEQAVAYMSRRLMENKSGVETADTERRLLGRELRRRTFRR